MDVMNVEQAKIAEEAGASAVMALGEELLPSDYPRHREKMADLTVERIPANIRRDGGVARMVSAQPFSLPLLQNTGCMFPSADTL